MVPLHQGVAIVVQAQQAFQPPKGGMQSMGPVRLKDVDEAQMYMVTTAKDLAEKGEIVISESKGEDELVY